MNLDMGVDVNVDVDVDKDLDMDKKVDVDIIMDMDMDVIVVIGKFFVKPHRSGPFTQFLGEEKSPRATKPSELDWI